MNKDDVKKALKLIDDAKWDDEFEAWVENNQEELDFEYDTYRNNVYETIEEPDSFDVWALARFVSN